MQLFSMVIWAMCDREEVNPSVSNIKLLGEGGNNMLSVVPVPLG